MMDKKFIYYIEKKQDRVIRPWYESNSPRLNMAIPRPASDKIFTEPSRILGMSKFHLHFESNVRKFITRIKKI